MKTHKVSAKVTYWIEFTIQTEEDDAWDVANRELACLTDEDVVDYAYDSESVIRAINEE